jgi:hypothetical protein
MVVEFTTVTPVMLAPVTEGLMDTVVPVVKFVPVRVTATPPEPKFVPVGAIEVSVAVAGLTTVKVTGPMLPVGVVTETFLAPRVAVAEIVRFAVTVVEFTAAKPLTVMPVPDTVTAVAPFRLVPVSVTGILPMVPRAPEMGAIEVSVGGCTVNVTPLLLPPPAVTVMVRAPTVALFAMVKVAVTVVEFTAVKPLTVTPFAGAVTLTEVAVASPVPVRVTGTVEPTPPVLGAIWVSVAGPSTENVTAVPVVVPTGVVTLTV